MYVVLLYKETASVYRHFCIYIPLNISINEKDKDYTYVVGGYYSNSLFERCEFHFTTQKIRCHSLTINNNTNIVDSAVLWVNYR